MSAVRFSPFRAAPIALLVSAVCFCPTVLARIFSTVSGDIVRPVAAALILTRASSRRGTPGFQLVSRNLARVSSVGLKPLAATSHVVPCRGECSELEDQQP